MAEGTLERKVDREVRFVRTPEKRNPFHTSGLARPEVTLPGAALPNEASATRASDVHLSTPPSSAAGYHDPTWVVQCAWSVFRLSRLQELIRLTIVDLQSLPRPELLEHEWAPPHPPQRDPVTEALKACCEELRDASGMGGADADRAEHCELVRAYMQQQPAAWSETFAEALDKYRRVAARALESAFARAAVV